SAVGKRGKGSDGAKGRGKGRSTAGSLPDRAAHQGETARWPGAWARDGREKRGGGALLYREGEDAGKGRGGSAERRRFKRRPLRVWQPAQGGRKAGGPARQPEEGGEIWWGVWAGRLR